MRELLQDINAAMTTPGQNGGQEYFLGTIVLVDPETGKPAQVSDGQQRLATTTIILARIRDIYESLGESARASSVQTDYIVKIDLDSAEKKAHLTLNTEDNAFFFSTILEPYPHKADTVYKHSTYKITNELEKYGDTFGLAEVKLRQIELAGIAASTWPLTFA